jgi:hypothetical protein
METISFRVFPPVHTVATLAQELLATRFFIQRVTGEIAKRINMSPWRHRAAKPVADTDSIIKRGAVISQAGARQVHFVGSIPLAGAEEVFRAVAPLFGRMAPRIPDGETGDRSLWIQFQRAAMEQAGNLAKVKEFQLAPGIVQAIYKVEDTAKPVDFGSLRYAHDAVASYKTFAALKAAGLIESDTRFQVALPTPLAVTAGFVEPQSQEYVEHAYERRLLDELQEILSVVPHRELAVQWDVAYEVIFMEGWAGSSYFDRSRPRLLSRLAKLGDAVPSEVSLGYHLCYGDPGHKHLVEPTSLALCVEIANALSADTNRPIDWIHMPVPRDRGTREFFEPLGALELQQCTGIFLGLIHFTDGFEGTMQRLSVAEDFLTEFGVATECGFGRRDPRTIVDLLALHKRVAMVCA